MTCGRLATGDGGRARDQSPAATGEREEGEGGDDLVSRSHIQSPTRPARPATRPATGERGEGRGKAEKGGG